jgi:hypothetical protein
MPDTEKVIEATQPAAKVAAVLRTGPKTVKNISNGALHLSAGTIAVGKTGSATVAEMSNLLGKYIEEV